VFPLSVSEKTPSKTSSWLSNTSRALREMAVIPLTEDGGDRSAASVTCSRESYSVSDLSAHAAVKVRQQSHPKIQSRQAPNHKVEAEMEWFQSLKSHHSNRHDQRCKILWYRVGIDESLKEDAEMLEAVQWKMFA
jgi:hypothetical protein